MRPEEGPLLWVLESDQQPPLPGRPPAMPSVKAVLLLSDPAAPYVLKSLLNSVNGGHKWRPCCNQGLRKDLPPSKWCWVTGPYVTAEPIEGRRRGELSWLSPSWCKACRRHLCCRTHTHSPPAQQWWGPHAGTEKRREQSEAEAVVGTAPANVTTPSTSDSRTSLQKFKSQKVWYTIEWHQWDREKEAPGLCPPRETTGKQLYHWLKQLYRISGNKPNV